ncbi:hypothetical protein [Bacteroides faecis]|uniref:hypothetical protein n=1 Tax=Bacteroides faecis TaxID=674529 RepID=UPI00286D885E|nr:hypothetical protein [Bacteroides faecis]MCS2237563.1 hypothetical protein [Bacteroides faecis]
MGTDDGNLPVAARFPVVGDLFTMMRKKFFMQYDQVWTYYSHYFNGARREYSRRREYAGR